MGHPTILILACCMLFVTVNPIEGTAVGINWARMTRVILLPSMVVEMLLSNGVQKIKMHSFNRGVVQAFAGSKLEMMITIPNVETGLIDRPWKAEAYVKENVTRAYSDYGLNVKYLLIGNEPYTIVDNYTSIYQSAYDGALRDITKYLLQQPQPYNQIKATIPHAPDVLISNITKPSDADFNDIVKERMLRILKTLDSNRAPFMVNIYPHLTLLEKGYPFDFAFFDYDSDFKIIDGTNVYTNVFDLVYDSFVHALQKYGYDKMEIIVSQVGWPTDGHIYANLSTAQRFYDGFIKKMASDEGTPLRPGPMEAYIYNLNDENNRDITYRGPSIRHYGIYDYKGKPKFQLDLTMKGRKDVQLEPAHGVVSMPRRWCVYNDKAIKENHTDLMMGQFKYACSNADCSRLYYGASYNNLTFEGNISYAFNNYFQVHNQRENECNFKGLGQIQVEDPSVKYGCHFPLQFLSTIVFWGQAEMGLTLAATGANALMYSAVERLGVASGVVVTLPILSFIFLVIFVR